MRKLIYLLILPSIILALYSVHNNVDLSFYSLLNGFETLQLYDFPSKEFSDVIDNLNIFKGVFSDLDVSSISSILSIIKVVFKVFKNWYNLFTSFYNFLSCIFKFFAVNVYNIITFIFSYLRGDLVDYTPKVLNPDIVDKDNPIWVVPLIPPTPPLNI